MFKHILVPTDGSDLSQQAVDRAIAFAVETGARLTFFNAEPAFPAMYYGTGAIFDASMPRRFHDEVASVGQAILAKAAAQAQAGGVACDTLALASDSPYEAIIEAAGRCGCDLIFMASHGRRGIDALLLGSETQKVLTHSSIPVLVYR